jgi:hypothetical protein
MKFSLNFNLVLQTLGGILQFINMFGTAIPAKYQSYVAAVVTAIQALLAIVAHFNNPDGTPATVAYVKTSN